VTPRQRDRRPRRELPTIAETAIAGSDPVIVGADRTGGDAGLDLVGDGGEAAWEYLLERLAARPAEEGWVTLEEASSAAGVARSTLRSWYRTGVVPSRMVPGPHGPQRVVPLEGVLDRALRSSRVRRQLERARSLEAELAELRRRVEALEEYLGLQ